MEIFGEYQTSVIRALSEIDKNWKKYKGLIICGSHHPENTEVLIEKIREARENGTPYLGICFGYQLVCIEWARNKMGIKNATSEEWGQGIYVVKKRKDGLNVGLKNGESYWNNYEVVDWVMENFAKGDRRNMWAVPYHPEYQSSKDNLHPVLLNFLEYARNKNR